MASLTVYSVLHNEINFVYDNLNYLKLFYGNWVFISFAYSVFVVSG